MAQDDIYKELNTRLIMTIQSLILSNQDLLKAMKSPEKEKQVFKSKNNEDINSQTTNEEDFNSLASDIKKNQTTLTKSNDVSNESLNLIHDLLEKSNKQTDFQIKQMIMNKQYEKMKLDKELRDEQSKNMRHEKYLSETFQFYDRGYKKDRGKTSFLQKLFESRASGGGIFGSIAKSAVSSLYQSTLKDSVDSIKKIGNALSGRVGTGTHEYAQDFFEEMKKRAKNEEIKFGKVSENTLDVLKKLGNPKLQERSERSKKISDIKERIRYIDEEKKVAKGLLGFGSYKNTNKENKLSSTDEVYNEKEDRFQRDEIKYDEDSNDALRDIQDIFSRLSDPVSGKKLNIRFQESNKQESSKQENKDNGISGSLSKIIPLLGVAASTLGLVAVAYKSGESVLEALKLKDDIRNQQESRNQSDNMLNKAKGNIDSLKIPDEQKKKKKDILQAGEVKTRLEKSKDLRKEYNESWNPLKMAFKNEDMLTEDDEKKLQQQYDDLEKSINTKEINLKKYDDLEKPVMAKEIKLNPKDTKTEDLSKKAILKPADIKRIKKEDAELKNKSNLEPIANSSLDLSSLDNSDLVSELKDIKTLLKTLYGGYAMNAKIDRHKEASTSAALLAMSSPQTSSNVDLASSPKLPEFTQNIKP